MKLKISSTKKSSIAEREEAMLKFWRENKIFEKSLAKPSPKGEFVFYEGPPTANGRPGLHHLEARAFKDAIPRYKTMRGYHVRRKGGWDTHGLPVELEVEKTLGFKSKQDIEKFGIAEFNKKCRESVWKYVDEWEKFTERIGFWLDQTNPYITYDPKYIESVWHILAKVHERGLLYKDYKVLPWCPRCGTALSSHELAQGYKDVKDVAVTAKFMVKNPEKIGLSGDVHLLAWTTTPWTLPGNVGLAVNSQTLYGKFPISNFQFSTKSQSSIFNPEENAEVILAVDRAKEILGSTFQDPNHKIKGSDLVGLAYEPLYPFLEKVISDGERPKLENAYKVYAADFVNTEEGTGIVHTAVMYGQDDFELGSRVGLPRHHLVDESGHFVKGTDFLEGKFVRDDDTAVDIIKDLARRGLLFKKEKYEHSYPHCWRCKTALIYYARDSWYIRMSDLRDPMITENEKINWIPAHIKAGRFGEWLKEVKDWAISRSRYWGTPLPVWVPTVKLEALNPQPETNFNPRKSQTLNQNSAGYLTIGSIEELKKYTKKSGNKYFVMRHGEAENNVKNIISSVVSNLHHLTDSGAKQVRRAAQELLSDKIDIIYTSPFIRTKETADLVAEELGLDKDKVVEDERIREVRAGKFDGRPIDEYHAYFNSMAERFERAAPDDGHSENYTGLKRRMGEFLYFLEGKYSDKTILIVTHDAPAWLLFAAAAGHDIVRTVAERSIDGGYFIGNAEVRRVEFSPIPHNENYELDLHRPYIDDIVLEKDGAEYHRVPEVLDVWFDSGAMPFAQDHYPFENKELLEKDGYPADYISEAIDQTRGWFYTLHAIGVLMERGRAYKNVICLGHLLDREGKKMSKSVGNVVNPWEMTEKYGADVLRMWMYSINQPGDPKNFDERSIDAIVKKVFNLLTNVVAFYEQYKNVGSSTPHIRQVLDCWIIARFRQLATTTTKHLDAYSLLEPAREIRDFIADLSQWYIRRSRERFKDEQTRSGAIAATRHTLMELSKLMAPFIPFMAEEIYLKVKATDDPASVHLADWPYLDEDETKKIEAEAEDEKLLADMAEVRRICSLGLEARERAGIRVRQPLSKLRIAEYRLRIEESRAELIGLIKDELNVKEVVFDDTIEGEVALDTEITPELKREGQIRELQRIVQDMRKAAGLIPEQKVILEYLAQGGAKELIGNSIEALKMSAGLDSVRAADPEADDLVEFKIDDLIVLLKISQSNGRQNTRK